MSPGEGTHHPTRAHDFRVYKPLEHPQEAEMDVMLVAHKATRHRLTFIPHSAPLVRGIFDGAGVHWQTHAYRAGYGGGTIAQWFANADIDVIYVGIGILRMHSPMDVSSKADLWELYRGFKAFFGVPSSPVVNPATR